MAAPGKFESENRRLLYPVLSDTEIIFSCFPTNLKYDSIFNNLTLLYAESGGSLKVS